MATTPTEGSWYKLKADLGSGHGMIPKGSMCQVTHVFPEATLGMGTTSAGVVLRFLVESTVTRRVVQRRFTVQRSDFAKMFTAGTEPDELARWESTIALAYTDGDS